MLGDIQRLCGGHLRRTIQTPVHAARHRVGIVRAAATDRLLAPALLHHHVPIDDCRSAATATPIRTGHRHLRDLSASDRVQQRRIVLAARHMALVHRHAAHIRRGDARGDRRSSATASHPNAAVKRIAGRLLPVVRIAFLDATALHAALEQRCQHL